MAYYQFTNFLTDFLVNRFGYQYIEATNMFTIIPICIMISIPIISPIVTVKGRKDQALLIVSILAVLTYYWMYTMPAEPSIKVTTCLVLTAIWFSIYSSVIWSSFMLVVPQQGIAVALGIATTIQNILMTVLPVIFGKINTLRTEESYNKSLLLLILLGICGFLSSLALVHEDKASGNILSLPENNLKVMRHKQKLGEEIYEIFKEEEAFKNLKSNSPGIELAEMSLNETQDLESKLL
jgi:Na+/melibiose symporter-like transporter